MGTFTVNVTGSFMLGLLIKGCRARGARQVRACAVLNVVISIVAGLGAAICGIAVAEALWP